MDRFEHAQHMEGLFRFETVIFALAFATVFLLVLVALARHDARS